MVSIWQWKQKQRSDLSLWKHTEFIGYFRKEECAKESYLLSVCSWPGFYSCSWKATGSEQKSFTWWDLGSSVILSHKMHLYKEQEIPTLMLLDSKKFVSELIKSALLQQKQAKLHVRMLAERSNCSMKRVTTTNA